MKLKTYEKCDIRLKSVSSLVVCSFQSRTRALLLARLTTWIIARDGISSRSHGLYILSVSSSTTTYIGTTVMVQTASTKSRAQQPQELHQQQSIMKSLRPRVQTATVATTDINSSMLIGLSIMTSIIMHQMPALQQCRKVTNLNILTSRKLKTTTLNKWIDANNSFNWPSIQKRFSQRHS